MQRHWFMSWQHVSIAGGACFDSCVLEDTHPFEHLADLQRRNEGSSARVSYTLLSFRPITAQQYALAEDAGLA